MSVLLLDSFDDRATAQLGRKGVVADTGSIIQAGGTCGSTCYTNSTAGGDIRYGAFSDSEWAQVGLAWNPTTHAAVTYALAIGGRASAVAMAFVQATAGGDFEIYTGPDGILGTLIGTDVGGQVLGQYSYIELRVRFHDTLGEIYFYRDGVLRVSATGIDTLDFSSPALPWGTVWTSTNGTNRCVDDLYIMDGAGSPPVNASQAIGPVRVQVLLPQTDAVGGGGVKQWTPSSGTDHGALVDEATPDDDATYVHTTALGADELFRFPDLVLADTRVHAVQAEGVVRKTAIGPHAVQHISRPNVATYAHDVYAVSNESYVTYRNVQNLNPETSVPYTVAAFNATQFGLRLVAP